MWCFEDGNVTAFGNTESPDVYGPSIVTAFGSSESPDVYGPSIVTAFGSSDSCDAKREGPEGPSLSSLA